MDGILIDYYGTANEAIGFDNIKRRIDKIVVSVRNWIQRVMNWISTKFAKFINMDQVQISQNYYNEIMGTIKSIINVNTISIDRIAMDFHTIRNNPEAVKKAGENIAKKLQDMKDLKENMEKISPSENDRKLTLTQSNLKSFQSQLYSMRDEAQRKLQVVMRMKREPLDNENLKYTRAQVMLIGQTCLINQIKSQLCIDLMDKLMKNSKVVEKNTKKKEDDIVDDDANTKKRESNINNHQKMLRASESVIQMCDELYITEEKILICKEA